MCSHNIGPYVNVWQLVSHLAIVTCDNVFKKVLENLFNIITFGSQNIIYFNKHTFFLINKALLLCEFISKVKK